MLFIFSTKINLSKFQKDVSLANDELLGDLMADLHKGPDAGIKPVPIKLKKKPVGSTK